MEVWPDCAGRCLDLRRRLRILAHFPLLEQRQGSFSHFVSKELEPFEILLFVYPLT
jgi:hypothetical protein